jgi:transposase
MEWFEKKLLYNCPLQSIIVLDNAKYHNAVVKKISTNKAKRDMIDWLRWHGIPHEPSGMLKAELFTVIKTSNPAPVYQTDVFVRRFGHDCLRLTVGHCELNPIEFVWAQVKGDAARNNTGLSGFNTENIKRLVKEGVDLVTPERWSLCVEQVHEKVEKHYWAVDGLLDDLVELEIGPNDDDSSDSESETESLDEDS